MIFETVEPYEIVIYMEQPEPEVVHKIFIFQNELLVLQIFIIVSILMLAPFVLDV